jgi:hypothetical protein
MKSNRRDFIAGTTALGLLAPREARAAAGDPWVGIVHSAVMASDWELAFYNGLRKQGYEGDPSLPLTGNLKRVNILSRHVNGRYKKASQNLQLAVKDITDTLQANLKVLVAAGGLPAAQAAATQLKTSASTTNIPLVALVGRKDALSNYQHAEGIYFDDIVTGGAAPTNTYMQQKITDLSNTYGFQGRLDKIGFMYNGNSVIGSLELPEFTNAMAKLGVAKPLYVDALGKSSSGENRDIKLVDAFDDLVTNQGAQAVILSADPFFTTQLPKLMRIALARRKVLTMCYPLTDYGEEAKDAGMALSEFLARGPSLKDVYSSIGEIVGKRLANPAGAYQFTVATQSRIGQ